MNLRSKLQSLGPGIMFASTAIGVSHLVQSTRAGADFGFSFLWAIVLANILKYPFFEYGSRYANATGSSLLDGYLRIGKWMLWLYFLISFVSMFIVTAAVTFVSAGLLSNVLGVTIPTNWIALGLLVFCTGILIIGNFNILSDLLKIIGIVLFVSTIGAFIMTIIHGRVDMVQNFVPKEIWDNKSQLFLIALMGWMPTAVDLSTWNSLWTVEQIKMKKVRPTMRETLFDFNFGYIVSSVLSICFLTLGAYLMYGTGTEFSNKAPVFAGQVVSLFTQSLGDWSYWIIAVSSFSVMFSTTLAVLDGYGRSLNSTIKLLFDTEKNQYDFWLITISIGSYLVISQFLNNLKILVDVATIMSFVIAPLIAIVNLKVIYSKEVSKEYLPPTWMKYLSYFGIIFLIGFTIYFIMIYFF